MGIDDKEGAQEDASFTCVALGGVLRFVETGFQGGSGLSMPSEGQCGTYFQWDSGRLCGSMVRDGRLTCERYLHVGTCANVGVRDICPRDSGRVCFLDIRGKEDSRTS